MIHPAALMSAAWGTCLALYAVMPFQLIGKILSTQGFLVLGAFLITFLIGTSAIRSAHAERGHPQEIDFALADRILVSVSVIAILSLLIDLSNKEVFDLAESYVARSDQATALMTGAASTSSSWFQIGFLTYPASYAYLVRTLVFEQRVNLLRLGAFGVLPALLSALSVGGRAPLLYTILISVAAVSVRRMFQQRQHPGSRPRKLGAIGLFCVALILVAALSYFIAVFFARAEPLGGASGMFKIAEEYWGVGFRGPIASLMFAALGEEVTYVIFIFTWYIIQGPLMANIILTDYHGAPQLGVYGVDLISALVRRIDGDLVGRNFEELQQLGTYGFLPSAFGSLYVDFLYLGLIICLLWGVLAAIVFQRIRKGSDSRWLLLAPFVTIGIIFSPINTPLGFSNGFVIHIWVLIAFVCMRTRVKLGSDQGEQLAVDPLSRS